MFQLSDYLAPKPFAKNKDTATVFAELAINATREDQKTTVDAPLAIYPCLLNFELTIGRLLKSQLFTSYQSNANFLYLSPRVSGESFIWAYHF